MKLLTEKKQNEILEKILATTIIAYDEIMKSDDYDYRIDKLSKINNNLIDAAYLLGGKNALIAIGHEYVSYFNKKYKQWVKLM